MTLLVIDIGNTRVKWALAEQGRLITPGEAVPNADSEDLRSPWSRLCPPEAVRYVTTSPGAASARITALAESLWGITPRRAGTPTAGGGIRVAYEEPAQMGPDRWLAMAGAAARGLLPACVVDCGSAITVDAVDARGRHLGGVIVAGLATQRHGLASRTPGLPPIDLGGEPTPFGTSTQAALRGGLILGTASTVEGLYTRMRAQSALDLRLVLTGGDAQTLLPHLPAATHARDLVLEGLARL